LRRELRRLKGDVGAGFFYGKVKRCTGTQCKSVAKLRISNGYHTVGPLKIESVRESVRIHEVGECLSEQDVLYLRVGVTQARRGRVGSKQIAFQIETHPPNLALGTLK